MIDHLIFYMKLRDDPELQKRIAEAKDVPKEQRNLLKKSSSHRDASKMDPNFHRELLVTQVRTEQSAA